MVMLIVSFLIALQNVIRVDEKHSFILPGVTKGITHRIAMTRKDSPSEPLFLVHSRVGEGSLLNLLRPSGEAVFRYSFTSTKTLWRPFQFRNKVYLINEKLYVLDLETVKLDSTVLPKEDYFAVQICEFEGYLVLLADSERGLDVYALPELALKYQIKREEHFRWRHGSRLKNGFVTFSARKETIEAYDLKTQKAVWRYDLPKHPLYWLGVKVGNSQDWFLTSHLFEERGEVHLIATSLHGSLIKANITNKDTILYKERFKGTGNNAGLISNFSLRDMDGDGILDLVGASNDNNVYALSGKDFSVIWEFSTGYENQMPCSLADINGDKIPEVFTVSDEMELFVIDGKSGKSLYSTTLQEGVVKGNNQTEVWIGDFDGDGALELAARGGWGLIKVFEIHGVKVAPYEMVWNPSW